MDTLYNHFLQSCITEPRRIIKNQKPSIVDNIFTNILDKDILSDNIKAKITDHLPNFIIINNIISRPKRQKITKRDYSNFVEEIYLRDIASIFYAFFCPGPMTTHAAWTGQTFTTHTTLNTEQNQLAIKVSADN